MPNVCKGISQEISGNVSGTDYTIECEKRNILAIGLTTVAIIPDKALLSSILPEKSTGVDGLKKMGNKF